MFWLCCISSIFALQLHGVDLVLLFVVEYTDADAIIKAVNYGKPWARGS